MVDNADLQIEYALVSRAPEDSIFPVLDELGIGSTLYGILSRGLLGGSRPAGPKDFRSHLPRFAEGNREQNDAIVSRVRTFAAERGMSPAQLALAWVLAKRPNAVPLAGARTVEQLTDALGALEHPLSPADLARLEELIPKQAIAGTRYDATQMQHLDSER